MKKLSKAYFLSHNGLGDNITSISAINFLSQYYNVIYFLCKDIYENNVKLLFENNKSIIVIPFNYNDEYNQCKEILKNALNEDKNINIFVSGCHKNYINSIISHEELIHYQKTNKNYKIDYSFIENFYKDINLDLSIYYEYFNILILKAQKLVKNYIKILKIII